LFRTNSKVKSGISGEGIFTPTNPKPLTLRHGVRERARTMAGCDTCFHRDDDGICCLTQEHTEPDEWCIGYYGCEIEEEEDYGSDESDDF